MQPRKSSFALNVVKGAAMMLVLLSALGAFAGTATDLYDFTSGPGPDCNGMVFDTSGNLYGNNWGGGASGGGQVIELSPPAEAGGSWTETTIYSFDPYSTTVKDGAAPCGSLAIDAKGNLYGTTLNGGTNGSGTVYELSPPAEGSTTWTETILYNFGAPGSLDGYNPVAGVTLASSAALTLYGTTVCGGTGPAVGVSMGGSYMDIPYGFGCSNGSGTVYELSYTKPTRKNKGGWKESVLYNFGATSATDGALPSGSLVLKGKDLYGTTTSGGNGAYCVEQYSFGCGIAYELLPGTGGWTETVLYNFGATATDSEFPVYVKPLIIGTNIYGTASTGGTADGSGTVWELVYSIGSNTYSEKVLYNFYTDPNDGCGPYWQVVEGKTANILYGTTSFCGPALGGTLFKLTYAKPKVGATGNGWTETSYAFGVNDSNYDPYDELVKDKNGNLFGMTSLGGSYVDGNVFEYQP